MVKLSIKKTKLNIIQKQAMQILMGISLLALSMQTWASVQIQQWQTERGTKVMYVYAPQLPMLDINVSFDSGSARDGQQWGLASMMTTLLGLKTTQDDEEVLSAKINALGAYISGSTSRDSVNFTLRTLTREAILNSALLLFSQSLNDSIFDKTIFQRERKRLLVALKQQALAPSSMASKAFWQLLYGHHPYAHPISGTVETVKKLDIESIKDFYKAYIVTRNATISIVGNVDKKQAQVIVSQLLAGLEEGDAAKIIPKPVVKGKGKHKVISFDSSQTYFKQGQIGVERGHPDYYALFLGNHLLGGSGFNSLLIEELRGKRGLVYGVGSSFMPLSQPGPWLVGLSTKNKTAKEAQQVVNETIASFMSSFDNEHFQAIKDNLIGGFPLRIDSNGKIISYIAMIGFYNLPLNYLEAFPNAIEKLSKQEVLDAWQRHLSLNKMSSIMVGQPE